MRTAFGPSQLLASGIGSRMFSSQGYEDSLRPKPTASFRKVKVEAKGFWEVVSDDDRRGEQRSTKARS